MKLKKVISICLVGAMAATLLAGCSDSSEEAEETSEVTETAEEEIAEEVTPDEEAEVEVIEEESSEEEPVEEVTEEVEAEEAEAGGRLAAMVEAGSGFDGFDEMITINVMGMTLYTIDGLDEILDAVNEISEAEINVHIDYTAVEIAAYPEQLGLMLSGGEPIDLCMISPSGGTRYAIMLGNNELTDITDMISEYAPNLLDDLGKPLEAMTLQGRIYGFPGNGNVINNYWLIMRQDILDYLGLTEQAKAISSWSDAEAIFEAVYEAEDSLPEDMQTTSIIGSRSQGDYITYCAADNAAEDFSDHYGLDPLSDMTGYIRVEDGVVSNGFANEDFYTCIQRVRSWYENDWTYKDAPNTIDSGDTLMRSGACFCYFDVDNIEVETSKSKNTGYDVVCVNVCDGLIYSTIMSTFGWCVPVTATEPEAAVAFLGLMYTNPDITNLFVYGIEGRDYDLNSEGEAVVHEDAIYRGSGFLYNQFMSYPDEGEGGDYREISYVAMDDAVYSPYYGFVVDTDPILNEIAALDNVSQQYLPTLESGTVDPDETYEEFLDALDAAGIQVVIDFYQDALDEWFAGQ